LTAIRDPETDALKEAHSDGLGQQESVGRHRHREYCSSPESESLVARPSGKKRIVEKAIEKIRDFIVRKNSIY